MARVLLLIPSRTYRTHDFMDAASRLGIEVVVGSEHRPALAGLMEGRHLRLDFHDIERSTARIVDFSKAKPLAAVAAVIAGCSPNGGRRSLLVEDFIDGEEVAVEALLRRGELEVLAIFDKPDPLNGPFFEETIYVTPSRLPDATQTLVAQTTTRATRALGLTDGPIHAELRLNSDGPWVLEVAARSIGGLCSRTLRFGSGISLEELILRHAAGLPVPEHDRERRAAGVMMLPIPDAGVLREVAGQVDARRVAGIDGLVITIPPGEPLIPLPEGDRYLGFMFARADSPAGVEAALRRAHAELHIVADA